MKRFKQILCVLVNSKGDQIALERAVSVAENNHADLAVAIVTPGVTADIGMPDGDPVSADLQVEIVNKHKQNLEALVEPYTRRVKIEIKVLVGTSFLQIIREVLRDRCDLVIKVPEQEDWLDRLFGSDDMHVLRKCPCPVWLIKPQGPKTYRRILAAVDVDSVYSPQEIESQHALNRQILEIATSMALAESAELHIVHAWDVIGESAMRHGIFLRRPEKEVNDYVEQEKRRHASSLDVLLRDVAAYVGQDALEYLKPQTHLVKGRARKEIPALARRLDADLVVMGTVGRTSIPGFIMGNTAETILNQLDCSVLAIKPPGFVTPVTLED